MPHIGISLIALYLLILPSSQGLSQSVLLADEQVIRAKLDRWQALWSQTGAGKRYSLDGYEDLFVQDDTGGGLLTFDSYSPAWASTQIGGFDSYRRIWERDVNESFPGWTITRMDVIRVEIAESRDLAWSALNFWGEGRHPSGEAYSGSQHGTHIWRKIDGEWKIVHEHLTGPIKVRGQENARINGPADTKPLVESERRLDSGADGKTTQPSESDEQALRRLSREWIEVGFSPGTDAGNYDYKKYLSRFYLETPGAVVLHDNNDPQMRIETSARTYGHIWEELFPQSRSVKNELTVMHQVLVAGPLGLTSFTADAIVVTQQGESARFPVFYTIGWKKTSRGWRIVHEHGSNLTAAGTPSPVGAPGE